MPQLKQGILIAVEGIDGSGKSTLTKNLAQKLHDNQYQTVLTKEPGGSKLGIQLRKILHEQATRLSARVEYLLFAADRAQHFEELVIPSLHEHKIVISDRMADSSLTYQGYGRGLELNMITQINAWAMQNMRPDITIYVTVPIAVALKRINTRKEQTIFEQTAYLEKVADGFETLYKNRDDVIRVDGTQTPEKTVEQSFNAVLAWIQKNNLQN